MADRYICPRCGSERPFPFPATHWGGHDRPYCGTEPVLVEGRLGEGLHAGQARFYEALSAVSARELAKGP